MGDFDEKLNSILGNQEAMGQIMALARSLSGDGGESTPREPEPMPLPAVQSAQQDVPVDFSQLLGELDPGMLQLGMKLLREFNEPDDRNAALLRALRPFLREERRARLDRAMQIARMTHLIRTALGAMGEKGGAHV